MSEDDARLEEAIRAGAVRALRKIASALIERARFGTTEHDRFPGVFVRTSEAAVLARNAAGFAAIAKELEAGP